MSGVWTQLARRQARRLTLATVQGEFAAAAVLRSRSPRGSNQQSWLSITALRALRAFFLRNTPPPGLAAHLPLMTLRPLLLDSVSMGAVLPRTHSSAPPQLFAGKHSSFSGDVARGSSCTHKSPALFWEMKDLKDTYINTHWGKGEGHNSPSKSIWHWRGWIGRLPSVRGK